MADGRWLLGFGLVVAGGLVLLQSFDVLDAWRAIARWWPLLLVVLGAAQFVADRNTAVASAAVATLGLVLLGFSTGLLGPGVLAFLLPAAVMAVGVWIIVDRRRPIQTASGSGLRAFSVLGSRSIATTSDSFRRATATSILGALAVDLSDAQLAPEATVVVTSILGGVDVIVPVGWRVRIRGTALLGGWDDTTRRNAVEPGSPLLQVSAIVILGGLEVRHRERWR